MDANRAYPTAYLSSPLRPHYIKVSAIAAMCTISRANVVEETTLYYSQYNCNIEYLYNCIYEFHHFTVARFLCLDACQSITPPSPWQPCETTTQSVEVLWVQHGPTT